MPEGALVEVEAVEAVLVGAHPAAALAVDEGADHAGLADHVAVAEFVAHIVETVYFLRLHIDALLQEAQPGVAAGILDDAVDLALRQIYVVAEERIVIDLPGLRVVDGHAFAIVADHNLLVVAVVEGGHVLMAGHVEMPELAALGRSHVDTVVRRAHVDVACFVDADAAQGAQLVIGREVASGRLAVVLQQAPAVGHDPNVALSVFCQVVHGVDLLQRTVHLYGVAAVGDPEQSVARGAREDLAVAASEEARHIAGHHVTVEVLHLHVAEPVAVVGLQCSVHTQVEQAVLVLRDAVHVVAGHSLLLVLFLLDNVELVTVVFVEAVAGGHPDEAVAVEKYLAGETARQLLVGIE